MVRRRQLPNEWGGPRDAGARERGADQGSIHAALHKRYPGVRSQDTTLNPIVVERQLGGLVEVIQNMLSIDAPDCEAEILDLIRCSVNIHQHSRTVWYAEDQCLCGRQVAAGQGKDIELSIGSDQRNLLSRVAPLPDLGDPIRRELAEACGESR